MSGWDEPWKQDKDHVHYIDCHQSDYQQQMQRIGQTDCNCHDLEQAWKAVEAVKRVRELHRPWTHTFPSGLKETYCGCDGDMMFPNERCATIDALDSDQS